MLDDCCHSPSPFDSSTSQKAHTTLLDSGSSAMTLIIYNNAEEKAIGKMKKWQVVNLPSSFLDFNFFDLCELYRNPNEVEDNQVAVLVKKMNILFCDVFAIDVVAFC